MRLYLRVLIAVAVMALVAIVAARLQDRPDRKPTPLPLGKVKPHLAYGLLLAPDGSLWRMDFHQSGGAVSLSYSTFAPGNDWAQVSGWSREGVGIKEDGTLWFWQTPGFSVASAAPIQIGSDTDWASARHAWRRAVLLKKDGTLWFMGNTRADGRIGPVGLDPTPPLQVGNERDWIDAVTGGEMHWALKRDGTVWRWGWPSHPYERPQAPHEPQPVLLSHEKEFQSLDARSGLLAAIKRDGSIWLQGSASHFLAPDHIPVNRALILARAESQAKWVDVAADGPSLFAKHVDGSWWASGSNRYSSLGFPLRFGSESRVRQLTRIPFDLDVWALSGIGDTTLILTRDGGIYYMGLIPAAPMYPDPPSNPGVAVIKNLYHRASGQIAGSPLTEDPHQKRSHRPVRIGELPPSVISTLKRESVPAHTPAPE